MSDEAPTQAWQYTKAATASVLRLTELPDMDAKADGPYALDEEAVAAANAEAMTKKEKAPYGDVPYADSGFIGGKKRFPIDCKHVKAAWSYINQESERKRYTSAQYAHVRGKIISAYKRCFGESPPSA